jgi:hypothetical protein
VFDILKTDRLASEAIVAHLAGLEGRPWAEFGRAGKPITKHQLARLLKPFKLHPAVVRLADGTTPRGYKRESFAELWERYFQTATTPQPTASAGSSDFQTATPQSDVAFRNRPKAMATANCGVVAVCEGPEAGKEGNGHANTSFGPGADWFDVPPGAVLPPGCEIKMDMTTGRQRARRERVGTCARCRANVYRDNMVTADGDVLLHVPCARLWGEQ